MSRPINHADPTAPDFFQNLIIAYSPLGVLHVEFSEHILKRFFRRPQGNPAAQTLSKQTTQTETAPNTRCRSALRTGKRFLLQSNRNRNAAHRILKS